MSSTSFEGFPPKDEQLSSQDQRIHFGVFFTNVINFA